MRQPFTVWKTDLGMCSIESGELSPGLNPIEICFYPAYGFGVDEWDFEVGVTKGINPIDSLEKIDFHYYGNYFQLQAIFKECISASTIRIYANHKSTSKKIIVWEGEILPNSFILVNHVTGLSKNWDVNECIKMKYPKANLKHFVLPTISLNIPNTSFIIATAGNEEEHVRSNTPLLLDNFHPNQQFHLTVLGYLIGYGGMGGNSGMSTVTDRLDIIYPTNGLQGGMALPEANIEVLTLGHGFISNGEDGEDASGFAINDPSKRINQIGHPGRGGWPNGLNGKCTKVQHRIKLVKRNVSASVSESVDLKLTFNPAEFIGHTVTNDLKNTSSIYPPQKVYSPNENVKKLKAIVYQDGSFVGVY